MPEFVALQTMKGGKLVAGKEEHDGRGKTALPRKADRKALFMQKLVTPVGGQIVPSLWMRLQLEMLDQRGGGGVHGSD